jgi:hypothetical protein
MPFSSICNVDNGLVLLTALSRAMKVMDVWKKWQRTGSVCLWIGYHRKHFDKFWLHGECWLMDYRLCHSYLPSLPSDTSNLGKAIYSKINYSFHERRIEEAAQFTWLQANLSSSEEEKTFSRKFWGSLFQCSLLCKLAYIFGSVLRTKEMVAT